MPIPLPDLPQQPQTRIGAPSPSAGAMTATADATAAGGRALGSLAQSIASVSQFFHEDAVRLQQIENARTIAEARNRLAESYAQHQLSLESEWDPEARMAKTRAFLTSAKAAAIPADAPPVVERALSEHFDGFASQAMIRQAKDSHDLAITRAKQAFENELDYAVRANRMDLAEAAIANAGAILTPEHQEAVRAKTTGRISYNMAVQDIEADPIGASEKLATPENYPGVHPEAIPRLRSAAHRAANAASSDYVSAAIEHGANPNETDLDEWLDAGYLSRDAHAVMVARVRTQETDSPPEFDAATYAQNYTQIANYDPAKDPTGVIECQIRENLKSADLPADAIRELNSRLTTATHRTDPDAPTTAAAKPAKHRLEGDFASRISELFTLGEFGGGTGKIDHDNNPATPPRVNREQNQKAWNARMQFTEQWRAVLSTMPPEADFTTLSTAFETLLGTYRKTKPATVIAPPTSPAPVPLVPITPDRALNPGGGTFGGQPLRAPGAFFSGGSGSVFGGENDPNDEGRSGYGGTTGAGGKEGVAIPQPVLDSMFPNTSKEWRAANVAAVVRTQAGQFVPLPLADSGTAEWVWERARRPVLDMTPAAVRKLGGKVMLKDGKLAGVSGLENIEFAIVSTATSKPLAGLSWAQAQDAWWQINRAVSPNAAMASLTALRAKWAATNSQPAAK